MPLQIFPTFTPPAGGPNSYPMLYYAPQWQPGEYTPHQQQHHLQKQSSNANLPQQGRYDHDPSNASFLAMPTLVPDQPALYYTMDAHGNYLLLTPSSPQSGMTLMSSSTHNDIAETDQHIHMLLNSTRSDGSVDSQLSDPNNSFYDANRNLLNTSIGIPNRKSTNGKNAISKSPAYKTMMCNMFATNGSCSYGAGCQYAHGKEEIRPCLPHPKYKTQLCNKFGSARGCQYGDKCHFRHPDDYEKSSNVVFEKKDEAKAPKDFIKMSLFSRFEAYVGKNRKASTLKRSNSCNTVGVYTFKRFVAMQDVLKTRGKPKSGKSSDKGNSHRGCHYGAK